MRRLLLLLVSLSVVSAVYATQADSYVQKRNQLLSKDHSARETALLSGRVFDTQTPLGKHFYNTVIDTLPGAYSRFSLTASDKVQLKQAWPRVYHEFTVLQKRGAANSLIAIEAELSTLVSQARDNGWQSLYRFASAELVDVLLARHKPYEAILTITNVLQHSPANDADYVSFYDYPLSRMYFDLARANLMAGNTSQALNYCNKYENALSLAGHANGRATLCQAAVALTEQKLNDALKSSSEVLNSAVQRGDTDTAIEAALLVSKTYLAMNNLSLAAQIAEERIDAVSQQNAKRTLSLFPLYALLFDIAVAQGDSNWANHYLSKMSASPPLAYPYFRQNLLQQARAKLAVMTEDLPAAVALYQDLYRAQQTNTGLRTDLSVSGELTSELQDRELAILQRQEKIQTTQARNLTMLSLFTTTISLICVIGVIRLYRHKRKMESFTRIDQLTSVDNRWFAIQSINRRIAHMERLGDIVCVALIDIDHFKTINERFGYQAGDNVLARIAKVLKYQLRREDIIGRYGGEEFILLLSGSQLQDGLAKIAELRDAVASQSFPELEDVDELRFSCGIVEVSRSASPEDVISLCDSMLSKAKQKGRNQTCSAQFNRPLEVVSA